MADASLRHLASECDRPQREPDEPLPPRAVRAVALPDPRRLDASRHADLSHAAREARPYGARRGASHGWPRRFSLLTAERLAGLDERLQAAQDAHPALARHARGGLRRAFELVMGDRKLRDAVLLRLDLPRDATRHFGRQFRVVVREPLVHEAVRRAPLGNRLPALRPVPVARQALLGRELDVHAVEVLHRELRLRDRIPDLLRRCADEHLVDLDGGVRSRSRAHAVSSSSFLRSSSAETRCSVYLSIQRSWICRIGTGFKKCNFSRPYFRGRTRPASSSTFRCFITPNRVISSSASSSVSVRPSRSKSRSSSRRRLESASALKTASSSMRLTIGDQMVTCQDRLRTASACAGIPSAAARASTVGAIRARPSFVSRWIVCGLRNVSSPSPPTERAQPPVGST